MTGRSTPSHRLERGAVRCKAPAEAGEGARELWGGNAPTAPAVTGFERPPPGEIQVVPRTQYVRPEPKAQGDFFWRKQYERYQISMCHDL